MQRSRGFGGSGGGGPPKGAVGGAGALILLAGGVYLANNALFNGQYPQIELLPNVGSSLQDNRKLTMPKWMVAIARSSIPG